LVALLGRRALLVRGKALIRIEGRTAVTLRFRETDPGLHGLRQNSDYIAATVVRACRDMIRKRVSPVRPEFMARHHA
jgi:hypothetical protein